MKPLCIYHGNCADGFAAAWVVNRFFRGEVDFHPGIYQNPPPPVAGRSIIIVDFSYKRHVLEELAKQATNILILDHHKTAEADLTGFPKPIPWEIHARAGHDDIAAYGGPRVACEFDMNRSGAMITWDYFFAGQHCPTLLDHIQDRDLWLFKLEGTREIQANVFSYPYDFEVWDRLMAMNPEILRAEGAAIERKHHKDVAELVAAVKREMTIGGVCMPVANLPYTLTSDAGNMMAKGVTGGVAACYWDTPQGRVFSLRSTPEGLDVAQIAARYGGGGHRNAAGFRMPIGWEGDEP